MNGSSIVRITAKNLFPVAFSGSRSASGNWTTNVATNIVQARRNASMRVSRPMTSRIAPNNSLYAAA